MPNFPTYRGKLPDYLNPLDLRHYLLLAYWVFFRPTALHSYLYQADPKLYQREGVGKIRGSLRSKAYRNLYLMLAGAIASFLLLVGLVGAIYITSTTQRHTAGVNTIALAGENRIISASADGQVKVWDLQRGSALQTMKGHSASVNALAVTPDGKKAVSAGADGRLKVWDLERGKSLSTLKGHSHWLTAVALLPDGERVISASGDRTLKVWNLKGGKPLYTLKGHTDTVSGVAVLPGNRAISGGADGLLKIWDLQAGKELRTLKGHTGSVTALAVTPDGQRVVSASGDRTLKVWDLQQGTALHTLKGHGNFVKDVALTPDGKTAISASSDDTVKAWDIERGIELKTFTGHKGWVNAVSTGSKGQKAISASSDGTIKVWDIAKGTELHTLKGNSGWVRSAIALPDGIRAISADGGLLPKVWNLDSGQEIPMKQAQSLLGGSAIAFRIFAVLTALFALFVATLVLAVGVALFGVAGSILSALALGIAGGWIFSFAVLWADQVQVSPWLRDTFGAVTFNVQTIVIVFGIAVGAIVGVAFSLASRQAIGVLASIVFIGIIGVAVGVVASGFVNTGEAIGRVRLASGTRLGYRVGVLFNIPVAIGALRALFYPLELGLALTSRKKGHPIEWDELIVLPLPGTSKYIERRLQRDELEGLRLVADVARNPFQRAAAQRALKAYLHKSPRPLQVFYNLLSCPEFNSYVVPPISKQDSQGFPTMKQLLLGELAAKCVVWGSWENLLAERLIWSLTNFGRDRRKTPLTRFARLLYHLVDEKTIAADNFDLFAYRPIYTSLTDYPDGVEIAESFDAMTTFLVGVELGTMGDDLAAKSKELAVKSEELKDDSKSVNSEQLKIKSEELKEESEELRVKSELIKHEELKVKGEDFKDSSSNSSSIQQALRPSVLTAIDRLEKIAILVSTYQADTSLVDRLAALAKASGELDNIDQYVRDNVVAPEQDILRRIIKQWERAIAKISGELARKLPQL